ncbi:lambda exonuclease family protein [Nocardioides sp. J54]|uniref:lambda exonuclease family protein n=1 Tax=Nocardioides sp. J54 TaxID=935866 RepID=UPI00048A66AC|nr:lambda exonuclease family protein [Nocardioides sp. J54]
MTIEIIDVEQRSEAWFKARCGIVTASAVGKLITPRTVKPASNDESRRLVSLLAAERVTGIVEETPTTADMWRGIEAEPYARELYSQHHDTAIEVGFMRRHFDGFTIGYSPDGLVGDDGLIEIKSPRARGHFLTIVSGEVPLIYMAQLQTGLLVSGREWIDFVSYVGGMPLWVKRVTPDPKWQAAILAAVEQAETDIVEHVSEYERVVVGLPTTERIDFNVVELKGIA